MSENGEKLELLEKHETTLGQVYETFSRKFPEYKDFWSKISTEEMTHANIVNTFIRDNSGNFVDPDKDHIRIEAIINSLDYLKLVMVEASKPEMQMINALSIALDIEKTMIEKRFFETIEGSSPELIRILSALDADTKEHIARVEKAWAGSRK
jgi:hypothetical protein